MRGLFYTRSDVECRSGFHSGAEGVRVSHANEETERSLAHTDVYTRRQVCLAPCPAYRATFSDRRRTPRNQGSGQEQNPDQWKPVLCRKAE
jgi:hypothetical protein